MNFIGLWESRRFFIYDNDSSDNLKDVLAPYIQEKIVVYQYWSEHPGQISAYAHCIQHFKDQSRWIAFIDGDEFLFCSKGADLREMLRKYEGCPGVCVNWVCFGSSGYINKPQGLVIENFVRRGEIGWKINRHVKSIVQPNEVISPGATPHTFFYKNNRCAVIETGKVICTGQGKTQEVSVGKLRINHYMCKSFEEAQRKINSLRATKKEKRSPEWFKMADRNDEEDKEILRFLPLLKERLGLSRKSLVVQGVNRSIREYVQRIKLVEPCLANLNDQRGVVFLGHVFRQIAQKVGATQNGEVRVPGLCVFIVKQIEQEKDGQKVMVKRVIFKEATQNKDEVVNIREYVQRVKQLEPRLVNLSDQRAILIFRRVFEQISWLIQETPEGTVGIFGLGRFIIKQVKQQKDGREVVIKRVIFRETAMGASVKN